MIFIMLNAFIAILTESFKAEMRRASFGVTLAEVLAGLSLAILARLLVGFPLTRVVCGILEYSGAPEGTLEVPGFRTPLSGIPAYGDSHRAFGDWPGTLWHSTLRHTGVLWRPEGSLEYSGVLGVQLWAYVLEEWFHRKTSHSLGIPT